MSPVSAPTETSVVLSPKRVGLFLSGIVVVLLATHVVFAIGKEVTGHPMYFLPRLFNLGVEANVPSYFSALLLLFASGLLAVVTVNARAERGAHVAAWGGLAVGFLLLSVDEAAGIHDQFVGPLVRRVGDQTGTSLKWWFVYLPVLIGLALVFLPFGRWLAEKGRRVYLAMFTAAGTLYLGGVIGMESVEDSLREASASETALLTSITVEEGLEMFGVALFVYALLRYIGEHGYNLRLTVEGEKSIRKTLHHTGSPEQAAKLGAEEPQSRHLHGSVESA